MNTINFGGVEVPRDAMPYIRQLCSARPILCLAGYSPAKEVELNALVDMGLADCSTYIDSAKRITHSYTAKVKLLDAAAIHEANRETFAQFAKRKRIDISPADCRKFLRELPSSRKDNRVFPSRKQVASWRLEMCRAPDYVENEPEIPGDEAEFSSPGLTAKYVAAFLAANHLKTEKTCSRSTST